MSKPQFGSVTERLDRNRYETDTEHSHIKVDQEAAKAAGAGPLLVRICPAHVYSLQADGTIGVLHAACLECGTCLALAPSGTLAWEYPRSGMGVIYREG
ncbi:MAG: 4Fe-4S dicluster domain-containing protein [Desulfovibrio sp.]|jgi:ferredoxin like protein|nr:4Fe-4S dicluster domain-containing protein [Desulfovibrio sp.]